jgi:hypothetical protein
MKTTKYLIALSVSLILTLMVSSVSAQDSNKDEPVTVASILEKAKVPLSDKQARQLKAFNPDKGPEVYLQLYKIFSNKQKNALKKAFGIMPARGSLKEDTPRSLFLAIILENLHCPLTQEQVDQLKVLPMDKPSAKKLSSILTDIQKNLMEKKADQ